MSVTGAGRKGAGGGNGGGAAAYQQLAGAKLEVAERSRHFIFLDDPTFFFTQLDRVLK